MSFRFILYVNLLLLVLLQVTEVSGAGLSTARNTVEKPVLTILFYNAENFFHPGDEEGESDDEFTPEGERHWTFSRYRLKLNGIARVIFMSGGWSVPDVVAFCEIENRQVLEDLTAHPLLNEHRPAILQADGPDPRGMDVAVLFRRDKLTLIGWKRRPIIYKGGILPTREIIHLSCRLPEGDTIELFFNHWTSKYGGLSATEEKRQLIAQQLAEVIDSLRLAAPGHLIIVGGDLNDNSTSSSISILMGEEGQERLTELIPGNGEGSYKYRGKWDRIDHFFAGGNTLAFRFSCELICYPQLLEPDIQFNGFKPYRTYTGYRWNGGYSDHLPLLLRIYRAD